MEGKLFNFKGKASFEWEFESDMDTMTLIDYSIDNIKDDLDYFGELKNIKVTIKKGEPVEEARQ